MYTIKLPFKLKKNMLACGADMKGAFALASGNVTHLFGPYGDLSRIDNMLSFEEAVKAEIKRFAIEPGIIISDMHKGYFSTKFAEKYQKQSKACELISVQHHEAHMASVMLDNRINTDTVGVVFDGTGFGCDGAIWGGEFFTWSSFNIMRRGHLKYIPMPGGEAAIRQPWRMAVSLLWDALGDDILKLDIPLLENIKRKEILAIKRIISSGINSYNTSSMGRFFDAAASLILNMPVSEFDAQLPIALEKTVEEGCALEYDYTITMRDGLYQADQAPIVNGIIKDIKAGKRKSVMAAKFHNTAARMTADIACRISRDSGIKNTALSGGVFQNKYFTTLTEKFLTARGFKVYKHKRFEINDSSIAAGQIFLTGARLRCV